MHEYFLGQWDRALEHFRRSAAAYRDVGDLLRSAAAKAFVFHIFLHRGEFANALAQAREHIRVGQEGAYSQVHAWGLQFLGDLQQVTGPLDEAISHLQQAAELFKAIPDYGGLVETMADLGQCYVRQRNLQQALPLLEESNRLIAERRLRSHHVVEARNGLAEAYLVTGAQTEGAELHAVLRKAKRACRGAVKAAKIFRDGLAEAACLQGTYAWFSGRTAVAQKWWQRSLAVAEELRARYDLGMTYLEIGRRAGDRTALERAEAIFAEIGATVDLTEAQKLLRGESARSAVPGGGS